MFSSYIVSTIMHERALHFFIIANEDYNQSRNVKIFTQSMVTVYSQRLDSHPLDSVVPKLFDIFYMAVPCGTTFESGSPGGMNICYNKYTFKESKFQQ